MTKTTHLDIVSAEHDIFSGTVEMVVATGVLGEVGITPGHAPLITVLKPGEVRITLSGGEEEVYYVQGGLLEAQPHSITILADVALRADYLDEAAAQQAMANAEAAMSNSKGSDMDYSQAAAELARAAAQIRAIQKIRKNVK